VPSEAPTLEATSGANLLSPTDVIVNVGDGNLTWPSKAVGGGGAPLSPLHMKAGRHRGYEVVE
jgi:hypothetical protein